jgi:hypothetical protein
LHINGSSGNPGGTLLLERVEDVDDFLEPYRVDRPISVAVVALDKLEDAGPFAAPWLGTRVLAAKSSA